MIYSFCLVNQLSLKVWIAVRIDREWWTRKLSKFQFDIWSRASVGFRTDDVNSVHDWLYLDINLKPCLSEPVSVDIYSDMTVPVDVPAEVFHND